MARANSAFGRFIIPIFSWLSVFLTVASGYSTEVSCLNLLAPGHQFHFVDPRLFHDHYKLGEGVFGQVFLEKDAKGQFNVTKIYKTESKSQESQINNDLRAFRYLNKYIKRLPFRLPYVERLGENRLKMSYHPGRNVEDLLKDPEVGVGLKTKIKFRYQYMTEELSHLFREGDFELSTKEEDVTWLVASNYTFALGSVQFIIKPDNVIVDPQDLSLTLIDPY